MTQTLTVKDYEAIAKEFNALETDKERLQFLKDNSEIMQVRLDNDVTFVDFVLSDTAEYSEEEEDAILSMELAWFDYYHGGSEGVFELFDFIGIKAESV